jgi:hypothetical protein
MYISFYALLRSYKKYQNGEINSSLATPKFEEKAALAAKFGVKSLRSKTVFFQGLADFLPSVMAGGIPTKW